MAGYGAQPAPRLAPGTRAPLLLPARRCRPALLRPNRPAAPQLPGLAAAARGGRGDGSGGADRRAATTPPARPSQAAAPPSADASGWRTFWAAVDASAWLGTVGTAAAFLITQEAMLAAAPVVLPLLALYASRQRERLATEAEGARQLARLEALLLDLQADTADEVAAEVGAGAAAVGPTGAGAGKGHSCRAAPASLSINTSPAPLPGGRRGRGAAARGGCARRPRRRVSQAAAGAGGQAVCGGGLGAERGCVGMCAWAGGGGRQRGEAPAGGAMPAGGH